MLLSTEDLYEQLVSKHTFKIIQFEEYHVDRKLGKITKSGIFWGGEVKSYQTDGIILTVHLPYTGDQELFTFRATTSISHGKPDFSYNQKEIIFHLDIDEKSDYKSEIENIMITIKKIINWVNIDVSKYNNEVKSYIRKTINDRKAEVLKYKQIMESMDIPIKKNEEVYSEIIEVKRKVINVVKPKQTEFIPEPRLSDKNYKEIINAINLISEQFEKTPETFKNMGEESIRNIILVILNAVFEGTATGETFHTSGKTDIMLSYEGKVLFIAECKIYGGPKKHKETIDQLLSYVSWRDTKAAVIVFNRNQDTLEVIDKIHSVTNVHELFKKEFNKQVSSFLSLFGHITDKNRELYISTMVYDLPKE